MALVPVPGRPGGDPLTQGPVRPSLELAQLRHGARLTLPDLEPRVADVLRRLGQEGHEAALVGGSLRDLLLFGVVSGPDWDVATSAHPEVVARLFPGSTWENRFGTVTVRGDPPVEVTTYRGESGYSDRRRPDEVRFGVSLHDDLARRDFTINALAWVPADAALREGRLVDPWRGVVDLRLRVLRAVGEAEARFGEDALRLLRAVRFAAALGLRLDPATESALRRLAPLAAGVSGERLRDELKRILRFGRAAADPPPSTAFRLMEHLGLLGVLLPELAALRGVPQGKALPGDGLDHSLRAMDAVPPDRVALRLAALVHDLGKATTFADGHFFGHEEVGARLAAHLLRRLRLPRAESERIVHLVRHHMFDYRADWSDAAVRRFIRRVGPEAVPDLLALRRADNAASGAADPALGGLAELEQRVARELRGPITPERLAVNGHDLQSELGLAPGPALGRLLGDLFEAVLERPELNRREVLLDLARSRLQGERRATGR